LRTVVSFRDITPYTLTRGLTVRACTQLSHDITPRCYPRHYSGVACMTPLNNSNTVAYFRDGGKRGIVPIDFPMRIVELRKGDQKFLHDDFSRGRRRRRLDYGKRVENQSVVERIRARLGTRIILIMSPSCNFLLRSFTSNRISSQNLIFLTITSIIENILSIEYCLLNTVMTMKLITKIISIKILIFLKITNI